MLVIDIENDRKRLTFEHENIRESHQNATDTIRELENKDGYNRAALTYDGTITLEGEAKKDALICQLFRLDSYANRRFCQKHMREDEQFILDGEPFSLGDWDYSLMSADKMTARVLAAMGKT